MIQKSIIKKVSPCRQVGSSSKHHFFGYYNKTAWDLSDRYLLAQEFSSMDADLNPDLVAGIGYFDLEKNDQFHKVDSTGAWNWQMGSQLQWLDGLPGRQIIYNIRTSDSLSRYPGFGSRVYDINTGGIRDLPLPVYVVAPDSRYALCVDYTRLYVTHETIGYSTHGGDARVFSNAPDDDGIHYMDIATGESRLVLSYRDLYDFHHVASMDHAIHWVSHIEINPSSGRVLLLHRWTERVLDETCFLHRLITLNPDGSQLRLLECSDHPLPQLKEDFDPAAVGTFDYEKSEYQISHPLWRDDHHIVVWSPHGGRIRYHLYRDDDTRQVDVLGEGILTENGHMTFSRVDKKWLLSDTYPDSETNERILILFNAETGIRYDLGSFYTDPGLRKENRCDLHPRWSRDGLRVCIDSVHESQRQMYIVDVSGVIGVQA